MKSVRESELKFNFYYATKGDSAQVHPNVRRHQEGLRHRLGELFSDSKFYFEFLGARDLLNLARRQSKRSLNLKVVESLPAEGEGVVCLVRLKDYYSFITDESGTRRQVIFDMNVREYEGDVDVNKAIRSTLQNPSSGMNFWWLNNGITIVANKAPQMGKTLILEDPKVVNGLQTSQEIYRHFAAQPDLEDARLLLVRIIQTESDVVRNDVLRATNSQTKIPPYSLRATEKIHYDIEQFFGYNGLYYDRQRNYYKNLGRSRRKIISMQYLAQAVTAIVLQEPNNSRGRPTNLIKDAAQYERIFNHGYPLELYVNCARLMQMIDNYLRSDAPEHMKREKTNLRYHTAMFVAGAKAKTAKMSPELFVGRVLPDEIDANFIGQCASQVWEIYRNLKKEKRLDGDRIAKSREYDEAVLECMGQI